MDVSEVQIPALVTDRGLADVQAANKKGTYNVEDLNRVELAVEIMSDKMQALEEELKAYAERLGVEWKPEFELDFAPVEAIVSTRTDWTMPDLPNRRQMGRYLRNIKRICELLAVDFSGLPENMRFLTYEGANRIEEITAAAARALNGLIREKKRLIAGIHVPQGHYIYVPVDSSFYNTAEEQIYCCLKGGLPPPDSHRIYSPHRSIDYTTTENDTLLCRKGDA